MPLVRFDVVSSVAGVLRGVRGRLLGFRDCFVDERYYPPRDAEPRLVVSYFLVMVAMDHRLSRPGRPYEAVVDGVLYHGADLLYRLGRKKLEEDPDFFTVERLEKVTARDVLDWLCAGSSCPPDPGLRAALLRDLGRKLRLLYDGDPLRILREAGGRLYGTPEKPGLVDLLKPFAAYNDPVDKKPMLLAKFLVGRGLFKPSNPMEERVPVDNHVTRIALRLGLVELERQLHEKLVEGRPFTAWEDVMLRVVVREAWHMVARQAGVDDFALDDALWSMGRKFCIHGKPHCTSCPPSHPLCRDGVCVFAEVCWARRSGVYVEEHNFLDTWWY